MTDPKRDILTQVAQGTITPEEAADRIEELERTSANEAAATREPAVTGDLRTIRVLGDFRTAKIVGDPSVAEAIAEGPHAITRQGDTLVINAGDDEGGAGHWSFPRRGVVIGLGTKPQPIAIRMNPSLGLEVRLDAGSASIEGVAGPINGEIDAGAFRIRGFASPFDLRVDAGSITLEGVLDRGESRIRCEVGNVKVLLQKGSSVRVKAHADIGHFSLGKKSTKGIQIGGGSRELVVGQGEGTLMIEGGIGRVKVDTE